MMSAIYEKILTLWMMASATLSHAFAPMRPRRAVVLLRSQNIGGPPGGGGPDSPDDEALREELRRTKKELFGADIPTNDELRDAAKNAEDAFLAAMLEQTREFREIKSAEGSEGAVDAFMERIREEDERSRGGNARDDGEAGGGEEARGEESGTWQ